MQPTLVLHGYEAIKDALISHGEEFAGRRRLPGLTRFLKAWVSVHVDMCVLINIHCEQRPCLLFSGRISIYATSLFLLFSLRPTHNKNSCGVLSTAFLWCVLHLLGLNIAAGYQEDDA